MTRDEVKKILGTPESMSGGGADEYWSWNAENDQEILWGCLGLNTFKGHFGVVAGFDERGKADSVNCAVN